MEKRVLYLLGSICFFFTLLHAQWAPVPGKLMSDWSSKINPNAVLQEYPRPQLTREYWKNLNGLWEYSILPIQDSAHIPKTFQGNILVPFAVESPLSGVGKRVSKENILWYNKTIEIPSKMRKGRILLHFGGVDWATEVYINQKRVGSHKGGFDAFTLDITDALQEGVKQTITIRVWDPTNDGPQPIGKQKRNNGGIFYTPVSGIWQTVWLENVPDTYILSTRQTPDIDKEQLSINVNTNNRQPGDEILVTALDNGKVIASRSSKTDDNMVLQIKNARLWSPDSPFLYDLQVVLKRKGKIIDKVGSYFGMRKISMVKDKNGIQRMALNNRFLFQYGPLDQGWWPDGLFTAPTDEALTFDIEQTKALGFNMIRKHAKVEPARWYYHCDKLGLLVWQDMPHGDNKDLNSWHQNLNVKLPPGEKVDDAHKLEALLPNLILDMPRSSKSEAIYKKEWKAIMDQLYNYPSIVMWVPFNEAWGQFKTREIVNQTMEYDPSRLVNAASGGNFFIGAGPIIDLHYYPGPAMPDPETYGNKQIVVLGEFGGLGLPVKGHLWLDSGNWGYQTFENKDQLLDKYSSMINAIPEFIRSGLSAAVYTQTTDVETETNGIFTYDRKILKFPKDKMRLLHQQLYDTKLLPAK